VKQLMWLYAASAPLPCGKMLLAAALSAMQKRLWMRSTCWRNPRRMRAAAAMRMPEVHREQDWNMTVKMTWRQVVISAVISKAKLQSGDQQAWSCPWQGRPGCAGHAP